MAGMAVVSWVVQLSSSSHVAAPIGVTVNARLCKWGSSGDDKPDSTAVVRVRRDVKAIIRVRQD